jgi:hypothetical protein
MRSLGLLLLAFQALAFAPAHAGGTPPHNALTIARVTISCALQPDRSVTDCRIVEERPAGVGASLLARVKSPDYRVPEALAREAVGGRVTISVPLAVVHRAR